MKRKEKPNKRLLLRKALTSIRAQQVFKAGVLINKQL
jgi:hypothetical protein